MCRYKIIQTGVNEVVVANVDGEYRNHTHLKRMKTAEMLIRLMKKKVIPKSEYLRESVKRVTLDNKYIQDIEYKQAKDKDKKNYRNIGGRRA